MFLKALIISAISFFALPAFTQSAHGVFGKWNVYSLNKNGEKICYLASFPTKKTGNYKSRGKPYALVTYRKNKKPEVSFSSGYPYKDNSNVRVSIDQKNIYQFFTTSETPKVSWAKDSPTDIKVIENMKSGHNLKAKGTSQLGTFSEDVFSLSGFTKAYKKAKSMCNG